MVLLREAQKVWDYVIKTFKVMIPLITTITLLLLLSSVLNSFELETAKRGQIEQSVADDLSDRCLQTYTRGD